MKTLLFSAIIALATTSLAQETTTFILVRHAEKANDGTRNPPLSEAGIQRAQLLMNMLSQSDLTAIYSTEYERTKKTVQPLAELKNMDIKSYEWKDPKALMQQLITDHKGGTILISGHSNTTPVLANILMGEEKYADYDESDYGNLLIVTASEVGKGKVTHLRF